MPRVSMPSRKRLVLSTLVVRTGRRVATFAGFVIIIDRSFGDRDVLECFGVRSEVVAVSLCVVDGPESKNCRDDTECERRRPDLPMQEEEGGQRVRERLVDVVLPNSLGV